MRLIFAFSVQRKNTNIDIAFSEPSKHNFNFYVMPWISWAVSYKPSWNRSKNECYDDFLHQFTIWKAWPLNSYQERVIMIHFSHEQLTIWCRAKKQGCYIQRLPRWIRALTWMERDLWIPFWSHAFSSVCIGTLCRNIECLVCILTTDNCCVTCQCIF